MSKTYLNRSDFIEDAGESTGGLTGSKKVPNSKELLGTDENGKNIYQNYQLKPSIKQAAFTRKLKAGGVDRENFGEVLAAEVSRAITNSDTEVELVPKVVLVYDEENKQTLIASRYLNKVEKGNLDDYAIKGRQVETQKRHVTITGNSAAHKGELSIGGSSAEDQLLRRDLAKAIAVSALSGDHDVNPGNMMILKDGKGQTRIARIDFGHAFNDLLNAAKVVGGGVRNKDNRILDFLNRETISHIDPSQQTPKLWRDYASLVPSVEMAEAFKEIGQSTELKKGIDNALGTFQQLVDDLSKDEKGNKEPLEHIKKSLIAINDNISKDKIDPKLPLQQVLEKVGKNLGEFYTTGQKQMLEMSKLMELQVNVDKFIDAKRAGKATQDMADDLNKLYDELATVKGIGQGKGNIEWIKSDKDKPAFRGTVGEFVAHREKEKALDKSIELNSEKIAKVSTPKSLTSTIKNKVGQIASKVKHSYISEKIKNQVKHIVKSTNLKKTQELSVSTPKPESQSGKLDHQKSIKKPTRGHAERF